MRQVPGSVASDLASNVTSDAPMDRSGQVPAAVPSGDRHQAALSDWRCRQWFSGRAAARFYRRPRLSARCGAMPANYQASATQPPNSNWHPPASRLPVQGSSVAALSLLPRGATVPRRAFKDCGRPSNSAE